MGNLLYFVGLARKVYPLFDVEQVKKLVEDVKAKDYHAAIGDVLDLIETAAKRFAGQK